MTSRTRWSRLRYVNGMHHVVADDLLPAIREAMERASPPGELDDVRVVDSVRLERGGPCHMDRPIEEFVFHDLAILIPSEDFQELLARWKEAPRATSLGQDFYRLTDWQWQCLVVTPAQRAELLDLLRRGRRSGRAPGRGVLGQPREPAGRPPRVQREPGTGRPLRTEQGRSVSIVTPSSRQVPSSNSESLVE